MTAEKSDPEESFVEKRSHLRVPLRALQIRGESDKLFFFGYTRNLSLGGLFIQTTRPKPPGTRVRLQFSALPGSAPFECVAEVVWIRPFEAQSRGMPGMGMRFTELDEKASVTIEAFLRKNGVELR